MALNLKKIGKKLTEFGSRAVDQVNVFDNGLSAQTRQINPNVAGRSAFQQVAPVVTRAIAATPVARGINQVGRAVSFVAPRVPEISSASPVRFLNNAAIRPYKTTSGNTGQILQGQNPYTGSFRQQAGQATQDIINAASVVPVGKGVQLAQKGLPAIKAGLTSGAKIGAGFGAAQGVSTSLQNELSLPEAAKTVAVSTGIGTGLGAGLGVAAPVIGAGIKNIPKVSMKTNPKLASYDTAVKKQGGVENALPKGIRPEEVTQTHVFGSSIVPGAKPRDVDVALLLPKGHPALGGLPLDPGRAQVGNLHYSYFEDSTIGREAMQGFINRDKTGAVRPAVRVAGSEKPQVELSKSSVSEKMSAAAETERNRYKINPITGARNKVTATFDPYSELVKIDKKYAASLGKKYRDLPAKDRLDYLADTTAYSARQADELLSTPTRTGESVSQVIQRYGEGTPEGKEFNNYLNSKFALEVASKRGKNITNTPPDELAAFVKDYELRNTRAVQDAATIKAHSDTLLDEAANGGLIGKADAEFVKSYYQNYTPLNRVFSENLERPQIGGKAIGSIGRQKVLQNLEGSQLPLDDSFSAIVSRTNTAVSQANRARLAKAYLDRAQTGVAPGELLVGAGNKAGRKASRASNQEINAAIKDVEMKIRTAGPNDDISALQSRLDDLQQGKNINRENIAQLQDDPTTGKQVISGLVDGEPFKLEVPPELAKVLQGLDERKFDAVTQGMSKVMKVFQTAWTGFLNPVFSGVSFAFYDTPMSIINSKVGVKTLGARAIGESLKSFNSNSEFQKSLARSGAQLVGGSQLGQNAIKSAEAIAARNNIYSKIKFNATNPKELLQSMDVIGGKLANSTRTRVAKATYLDARKTMNEADALKEAAYAYNNVLPNYGRTSHLVRGLNAYIPYAGASVAGTRAMAAALRNNPAATAKLVAVGITPMVATAAYSLSSPEGQEFVNDMLDSKKSYVLDNNMVIVLPGAKKNNETGEWTGIVKIPVSPELRALNRLAWRETNDFTKGQNGASPTVAATSLFDFMTGGLRTSENPLVQTAEAVAGKDPRTGLINGKDLVVGDLAEKPKSEQVYSTTSSAAKTFSKLVGGAISPIQADAIIGQFSTSGQLLQNRDGNPVATLKGSVSNRFTGAYGKKDTTKFFENLDTITKGIKDTDDRKSFVALHAKDPNPGILDSAEKATIYLNRPDVVSAERKLDDFNRKQGKVGNPLFDLSDTQLQKVLAYRSAKMLNAGKQTYDKNGNPLFTSLGLDEPWYDKFRDSESNFYSSIKTKVGDGTQQTFSGAVKPTTSPELQKKLDYYYTLKSGTGERSRFLRANPDVLAYWEQGDGFTNKERMAIGLKPVEDENSKFAGSGGSGGSGGKTSTNPYKYAVSLDSGGSIAKPKISVKKAGAIAKAKKKTGPKVSIKKSMV